MRKTLSVIIFVLLFCISPYSQNNNSSCPLVTITGPSSAALPGEPMSFSVLIQGEGKNTLKYKWTVDKGMIVEGEETTVVLVSTEGLDGVALTATFKINGLPENCQDKFEEVGIVAPTIRIKDYDDYGRVSFEEELARLDPLLVELRNNSDSQGFIWIRTDSNESIKDIKKHIKKLAEYIKDSKIISVDRIIFAIEKSDLHLTRMVLISKFEELPKCENCEIIKGSAFK